MDVWGTIKTTDNIYVLYLLIFESKNDNRTVLN